MQDQLTAVIVMLTQGFFTAFTIIPTLSIAPFSPLLAEEWNISMAAVELLTGIAVLVLGYANFVLVPCSNIFGRRIVSIVCSIIAMGSMIWGALAKSHGSFFGARVLNGLVTAVNESIMVQCIADIYFIHQRGRAMGLYFGFYFIGLFIGPIISGNMAARYGWRSFFWLGLALSTFNTVTLFFFYPETRYLKKRNEYTHNTANDGQVHDPAHLDSANNVTHDQTVLRDEAPSIEKTPQQEHHIEFAADGSNPTLGHGHPTKAQFTLWQPINHDWRHTIFRDVISPWAKFFNPIILWTGLVVNGAASCLLTWNLVQSPLLSAPPYNFSVSSVGYSNFAFLGGGLIGLATAGPSSDWIATRMTLRNNGVREAEFRLISLIPYGIIGTIGYIVGGIGFDHHWPWPALLVVCFGSMGMMVTSVPAIAVAYAVDSYTPIAGDIMVVATVFKNTIGFGMAYWIGPMQREKGMTTPAMIQMAMFTGPILLGIPLYFVGKSLRRATRHSSWHVGN